jgi:L-alanine-DL-glutamate epimerase-like enolase superfamily enzyme
MVRTVRKAIGPDIDLLVDVNGCYTAAEAIAVAPILEDSQVCLFEEPCPNWELEWTAEVAAALEMMVSGGEAHHRHALRGPGAARRLLYRRADAGAARG